MRHFKSAELGIAACGANVGASLCFARHAVVDCQKCLVKLHYSEVKCSHPDCDWKGPLHKCRMTVVKKRICPRCAEMGTYERPNLNPVVDAFGAQIVLPPAPFPIQDADEEKADDQQVSRH